MPSNLFLSDQLAHLENFGFIVNPHANEKFTRCVLIGWMHFVGIKIQIHFLQYQIDE